MSGRSIRPGGIVRSVIAAAAVFVALAGAARPGLAQDWPTRAVTLTQTFAGGGTMDFAIRLIAQAMTEAFGQAFVVETKPGGSGIVGLIATAKAPPDGYSFVVTAIGPMVFRPMLEKNLGFDADKDFEPVILIGATPNSVLASPKLGVSTIAELKAWAAKHGDKLNIGMPGVGTMGQYCGVLLLEKLGIEGNFINYRGATPMVQDLVGGQIELGTPAFGPSAMSAKVLAIAADQRLDAAPDVPTLKEAGLDIVCATWNAILAPRGTPRPIIAKLNAAIDAYLKTPAARKAFNDIGLTPWGGPPERVTAQLVEDRKMWGPVVTRLQPNGK
jgi:tripartite-type tricarboxylate transporter receptor subunit TctC